MARACSSISKSIVAPDIRIPPLGANPANVPREDTPPSPPFDERPPLPFELSAYANWLYFRLRTGPVIDLVGQLTLLIDSGELRSISPGLQHHLHLRQQRR